MTIPKRFEEILEEQAITAGLGADAITSIGEMQNAKGQHGIAADALNLSESGDPRQTGKIEVPENETQLEGPGNVATSSVYKTSWVDQVKITCRYTPLQWKTGGVAHDAIVVEAIINNARVGALTAANDGTGNYVLDTIIVAPEYRRRGIAMEMLHKAHASVNMLPYYMTPNPVYQTEAGKQLGYKELEFYGNGNKIAGKLKQAGPLVALLPEAIGVGADLLGGAAAAGGEAAAGAAASDVAATAGEAATKSIGQKALDLGKNLGKDVVQNQVSESIGNAINPKKNQPTQSYNAAPPAAQPDQFTYPTTQPSIGAMGNQQYSQSNYVVGFKVIAFDASGDLSTIGQEMLKSQAEIAPTELATEAIGGGPEDLVADVGVGGEEGYALLKGLAKGIAKDVAKEMIKTKLLQPRRPQEMPFQAPTRTPETAPDETYPPMPETETEDEPYYTPSEPVEEVSPSSTKSQSPQEFYDDLISKGPDHNINIDKEGPKPANNRIPMNMHLMPGGHGPMSLEVPESRAIFNGPGNPARGASVNDEFRIIRLIEDFYQAPTIKKTTTWE